MKLVLLTELLKVMQGIMTRFIHILSIIIFSISLLSHTQSNLQLINPESETESKHALVFKCFSLNFIHIMVLVHSFKRNK